MSQGFTKGIPIDTDPTLSLDSDLLVSSQKAVKTYVDNGLSTKQNNLGFIAENEANKSDSFTVSSSETYASSKALVDGLASIPASEIIVLFKSTTQTIVTNKTVETAIYAIPLPNDGFDYMIKVYSQGQISTFAGTTITHRLRVGTFSTVIDGAVGANSIGQQSNLGGNSLGTNLQIPVTRNFIYKGGESGSITGAPNNANILDDANSASSFVLLTSRDLTVQNYLYISFNPSNIGAVISHGQILVTAIRTT